MYDGPVANAHIIADCCWGLEIGAMDDGTILYIHSVAYPDTVHIAPHNGPVSYTHLRAHETVLDLVCRLLLEKKKK